MGEATRDLLWVIGIFIALGFVWLFTGGHERATNQKPFLQSPLEERKGNTSISSSQNQGSGTGGSRTSSDPTHSPWYGQVQISGGNGRSEIQANREYITLNSRSREPITITGWKLVDSQQKVTYQSPSVLIPSGIKLYDPRVVRVLSPIILEPGDRAEVITGRLTADSPYAIEASFKVNSCSGYLADLPGYQFMPPLSSRCPSPSAVPGAQNLEENCYTFIKRLSYCHTPVFGSVRDVRGVFQPGYVDRTGDLSTECKNFLKQNYNYPACIDRNRSERDFYGQTWYIYLNLGYELWGKERETISLYDQSGLLVDQLSY